MQSMDFNVEARKLQLENLNQFISSYKYKIENVLTNLNWNIKDTLEDNQFITCSLDPSHKVPQKVVDKHINKCALRKEGYALNEEFLSEPQQGPSNIHINDHTKIEVLSAAHKTIENFKSGWNGQDPDPRTSNRLTATFSADERLALYDYAVANTIGPNKLPEFDIFTVNPKRDNDKPLTYEEKLALERDLKRRKIKYRSVHTSHKNHTEVLREVIESQMELYNDWLNNANRTPSPETEVDKSKQEHESTTSAIGSRSSRTSSTSQSNRKRHDEKQSEDVNDSRSTSRRSSIDRGSEKSMKDSNEHRKQRSRSRDSYHRRRSERYEDDRNRGHQHRRRSPNHKDRRDRYRRSKSRERRRSREKRQNGYRHRRS
ncbi:hypothetical protein MML48_7g00003379 [Holotrichia oblita]|uniref:Uncharacterized protein n=1 Tax=Holotrichia oblita TaxID=644536 RepID=A0ACB9SUN6_HOLOL|nr:hypothetical protein MML48_7g00003379 [Holotrichia oblita]